MGSQRVRQDLATELMCWCVSLGSSSTEFCVLPGPAYHVQFFAILWTGALQAHLSMELSRQESWSGLPFPTPGHLPNQGIELTSPEPPELADSLDICFLPQIGEVFITISSNNFSGPFSLSRILLESS